MKSGEETNTFAEESAGDDEGNVDGIAAHDDFVEAFKKASSPPSSSCRIH